MNENSTDLLDLIRFRQRSSRLQVENLGDAVVGENVVTSLNSFRESMADQKCAEIVESDVRIGGTFKYP